MAAIFGLICPSAPSDGEEFGQACDLFHIHDSKAAIESFKDQPSGVMISEVSGFRKPASIAVEMTANGNQQALCLAGTVFNLSEIMNEYSSPAKCQGDPASILLEAYKKCGQELFDRLDGYFAIAIWNGDREQMLLARDHIGIKEFYFTTESDRFLFSSQASLLFSHPLVDKELEMDAVAQYLAFRFVSRPATLLKNVKRLLPGNILIYRKGANIEMRPYASLSKKRRNKAWGLRDGIDATRSLLTKSIDRQVGENSNLGIFLSGGVDSSLLTALACQNRTDVETFSVGFHEKEYDETPYILEVADKFATRHNHLTVTEKDFAEYLPKAIYRSGHPLDSPNIVPSYMLYVAAAEKVQVCLTGEGADNVFGGLPNAVLANLLGLPGPLKTGTRVILSNFPSFALPRRARENMTKIQKVLSLSVDDYILSHLAYEDPDKVLSLLIDKDQIDPRHYLRPFLSSTSKVFDRIYETRIEMAVPDLVNWMDLLAYQAGIEIRYPFLDRELMSLAQEFPPSLLRKGFKGKYILKKLAEQFFSKQFVHRPKGGFGVPLEYWFRNKSLVGHYVTMSGEERSVERGVFKPEELRKIASVIGGSQRPSSADSEGLLWTCINFEIWCRLFLDNSPISSLYPPCLQT